MMTHGVKFTYVDVKEYVEVTSNSGCKLVSTEYIGANDKLDFECACGDPFVTTFSTFKYAKKKHQCNKCSLSKVRAMNQHSRDQVVEYLKTKNYELMSEEYINTDTPIIIKDEFGYLHRVYLYNIKTGQNIKKFDNRNPFTLQNIVLWCKLNEKPFELISDTYVNAKELLLWKCLKDNCKKEFEMSWINIGQGGDCNICSDFAQGIYKGEVAIKKYLLQYNVDFVKNAKFPNCKNIKPLSYDFYLPKYNTCIEFQGLQHYKPVNLFGGEKTFIRQQKNDKIKKQYCLDNAIKLIEIPHFNLENVNEILSEYLCIPIV